MDGREVQTSNLLFGQLQGYLVHISPLTLADSWTEASVLLRNYFWIHNDEYLNTERISTRGGPPPVSDWMFMKGYSMLHDNHDDLDSFLVGFRYDNYHHDRQINIDPESRDWESLVYTGIHKNYIVWRCMVCIATLYLKCDEDFIQSIEHKFLRSNPPNPYEGASRSQRNGIAGVFDKFLHNNRKRLQNLLRLERLVWNYISQREQIPISNVCDSHQATQFVNDIRQRYDHVSSLEYRYDLNTV